MSLPPSPVCLPLSPPSLAFASLSFPSYFCALPRPRRQRRRRHRARRGSQSSVMQSSSRCPAASPSFLGREGETGQCSIFLSGRRRRRKRERALFADIGTALGRDAHIRSFLIASPPPREDGSAAYPPLRWRRMFRMDFFCESSFSGFPISIFGKPEKRNTVLSNFLLIFLLVLTTMQSHLRWGKQLDHTLSKYA